VTLKKKIIFFIAGLGLTFSLLFLWSNHLTIFHAQSEQKTIFAMKVASRVTQIVENEKKRIATLCSDWAAWDSMYDYIGNPTSKFIKEASPADVLYSFDLNLILITDSKRKLLFHQGFERKSGHYVQFDLQNKGQNKLGEFFLETFPSPDMEDFVVATEFGPLLAISAPITRSDGSGASRGRLLMGRLFDPDFNTAIGTAIQEKSNLLSLGQLTTGNSRKIFQSLLERNFYLHEGKKYLEIFNLFSNPSRQPVFAIKVDADKTLFSLQEKATQYFLISLMLSALLIGLLFFWFIDRMLLKRLQRISERARQILTFDDLSTRFHEERNDEIAQLSRNINKMLERLENENIRHQEMERRLVMNEKLVATGRLAANIAHEINNPLFAISNSIAVIKRQIKNASSDIAQVLPLAEKEIKRVRKITKKLLDYGKINLETFKESDIDAILDRACEVLKLSKQIKNTAIVRNKQKGELPVFCNPDSLQQVFMNLILNASEAMNGIGKVVIEVEPLAHAYEIHFRDSGPGFPPTVKNRIFEPFNSSKSTKGAGLGLYISYHIVKKHGGSIILDEKYRAGSHLIVTLQRRGGTGHA
jgi:signal transduction histidine kinase